MALLFWGLLTSASAYSEVQTEASGESAFAGWVAVAVDGIEAVILVGDVEEAGHGFEAAVGRTPAYAEVHLPEFIVGRSGDAAVGVLVVIGTADFAEHSALVIHD